MYWLWLSEVYKMSKTYSNMYFDKISKETIKRKIKELRKELKYTQEEFADNAGFPLITIQNWESRKKSTAPDTDSLIQLCNAYGVDMDYFTGRIEAHNRDIHFVMNNTGLSEGAVLKLQELKRKHPDALQILDLVLQSDSIPDNYSKQDYSRLSSFDGIFFLQSIVNYFRDRQLLDIYTGYFEDKSIVYKLDDPSYKPDKKRINSGVIKRLHETRERKDIEEFHITHDILKLSNVIYNQFVKFSPINAASIDLNQRIEIKKKE